MAILAISNWALKKTEIRKVFGQPKHIHAYLGSDGTDPIAWEYDNLLFGFDSRNDTVSSIDIRSKSNKHKEPSIGNLATINSHNIMFNIQPDVFEKVARNNDLYYKDKQQWNYYGWILEYSSGVDVCFQEDDNNDAPLFSFYIQKR